MFKVVQYWCHESNNNMSIVHIGVKVHFIKHTMFKSQILSGTKDEVGVGAKKWCVYLHKLLSENNVLPSSSAGNSSIPSVKATDEDNDVKTVSCSHGNRVRQEGLSTSIEESSTSQMKVMSNANTSTSSFWSHLSPQNIIVLLLCISIVTLLRQQMVLASKFDEIVKALNSIERSSWFVTCVYTYIDKTYKRKNIR